MLNRDEYRRFINLQQPLTNTGAYARVERAPAGMAWRVVCVYHLPALVNGGMHNVFVDCLDTGDRWADATGLKVGWTWEGRRDNEPAPPRLFEKNPPEPRAQIDMYRGQVTSLWIEDSLGAPSDKVHGLHTNVENGLDGNSWGHNSFVVLFKMSSLNVVTPTPPGPTEPTQPPTLTVEQRLAALEADNKRLWAALRNGEGDGR